MRIALVSEHASPLAALGGEDAGGQNVHVAALAAGLAAAGHSVVVHTRRDDPALPDQVEMPGGVIVDHVAAGPPQVMSKDDLLPHMDDLVGESGVDAAERGQRTGVLGDHGDSHASTS